MTELQKHIGPDTDVLDSLPAVNETEYVRHVRFDNELQICIDGRQNRAMVKAFSQ